MISVGRLHQVTVSATALLAALSVVGGSTMTAIAGVVLMSAVLASAPSLHAIDRSKLRTRAVHGVTVVVLIFAIANFRSSTIDAVLIVVMLGIFNRFVLRGGHRDDFLVIGACSVLLAAATTITPGVLFLFILLAFVPTLLWALWTSLILGTGEVEATAAKKSTALKLAAIRAMAVRPAPRLLAFIAFTGLGLMAGGYAAVSVLPRYSFIGLLGAGAFMNLPGAGSSMELRTTGAETIDDATVVIRVEPGPGQQPGALSGIYARLYVLDMFDGRKFAASDDGALFPLRMPADRMAEDRSESEFEHEDEANTVRLTLNRLVRDKLHHPLATLGRAGASELVIRHARQTIGGTWVAGAFRSAALTYKVRLGHRFEPRPPMHAVHRGDEVLRYVPDDIDPRVRELGVRLADGKETTADKVNAVLEYFGRGYTYSLEPLEGTSEDPLARFLFEAKRGHCELYAGAVAVLLRIAGVKTRVVTGYYNGTWNDLGGYLAFTQMDAHSWVEAYYEGEGWRWIDATPEDLRAMRNRPALAFLRDWYDAAEAYWFDNVLDFDEAKRRELIDRMAMRFKAMSSEVDDAFGESEGGGARKPVTTAAIAAAFVFALGIVPAGVVIELRRRRRRTPESLGRRLRRVLGAQDGENSTLGALVVRVPEQARPEASEAVALYESLRFGPRETAPPPARVLGSMIALERSLKRMRRAGR